MPNILISLVALAVPLVVAGLWIGSLENRIKALEKDVAVLLSLLQGDAATWRLPIDGKDWVAPHVPSDFADYLLSRSSTKDVPGDVARPARENLRRWTGGRT